MRKQPYRSIVTINLINLVNELKIMPLCKMVSMAPTPTRYMVQFAVIRLQEA